MKLASKTSNSEIRKNKMFLSNTTSSSLTESLYRRLSVTPRKHFMVTMMALEKNVSVAPKKKISADEARFSLVLALASQASSVSQRILTKVATETAKYVLPRRFDARNLEEALMTVPDLETVKFTVLTRMDEYEIREVEPYFIAETTMGDSGFDFNGSSLAFNALAGYLFGKNTKNDRMEMTTPVITRKAQIDGEKMEMTSPVITSRSGKKEKWQMSFVMPSKYNANLPVPIDDTVRIKEMPGKLVAVAAFSGFVTDKEVAVRERKLRDALKHDKQFEVKEDTLIEVAQYNPPFTLPFTRRNEIALEVQRIGE